MMWFLRREYIGTVSARTVSVDDSGKDVPGGMLFGRWILTNGPFLGRRAKRVGNPGHSPAAVRALSKVEAWLAGGPLPELDDDTQPTKPAPVLNLIGGGKSDD